MDNDAIEKGIAWWSSWANAATQSPSQALAATATVMAPQQRPDRGEAQARRRQLGLGY